MATAYLLDGDDDLREGVSAVQDMGVRVVLLGIPCADGRQNQSPLLVREADDHIVIEKEFWARHFSRTQASTARLLFVDVEGARAAGRAFAEAWAAQATPEEVRLLLAQIPRIPPELDVQLLLSGEQTLGKLPTQGDLRKQVRRAFWERLKALGPVQAAEPESGGDKAE